MVSGCSAKRRSEKGRVKMDGIMDMKGAEEGGRKPMKEDDLN